MGGVPEACWSGGTGQAWESWPPSEALAFRWGAQPCPGHRSKQESRSDLPGGFASSLSSPVVGGQGGDFHLLGSSYGRLPFYRASLCRADKTKKWLKLQPPPFAAEKVKQSAFDPEN